MELCGFHEQFEKKIRRATEGKSKYTKDYLPLHLEAYIAVNNYKTAINLEKYFKTGSGIAFMKKRILITEA